MCVCVCVFVYVLGVMLDHLMLNEVLGRVMSLWLCEQVLVWLCGGLGVHLCILICRIVNSSTSLAKYMYTNALL